MFTLTGWLSSMSKSRARDVVMAAEVHKLQTAARVIRHMIHTGQYDGEYMCVSILNSPDVDDNDKELARMVINDLINHQGTLSIYIQEQSIEGMTKWVPPIHRDYAFMQHVQEIEDAFAMRIVRSCWYLQACREIEARANNILRTAA